LNTIDEFLVSRFIDIKGVQYKDVTQGWSFVAANLGRAPPQLFGEKNFINTPELTSNRPASRRRRQSM
jgi:hypothetical protein